MRRKKGKELEEVEKKRRTIEETPECRPQSFRYPRAEVQRLQVRFYEEGEEGEDEDECGGVGGGGKCLRWMDKGRGKEVVKERWKNHVETIRKKTQKKERKEEKEVLCDVIQR